MEKIDNFEGDYKFLSNFYCPIVLPDYMGFEWISVEHLYQASKFTSPAITHFSIIEEISKVTTPGKTKYLANKKYKDKIRPDWNDVKLDYMRIYVTDKFTFNKGLKAKLLETGDAELIEGNWWGDTFFGVCKGVGENHLGKILMSVRKQFKEETEEEK